MPGGADSRFPHIRPEPGSTATRGDIGVSDAHLIFCGPIEFAPLFVEPTINMVRHDSPWACLGRFFALAPCNARAAGIMGPRIEILGRLSFVDHSICIRAVLGFAIVLLGAEVSQNRPAYAQGRGGGRTSADDLRTAPSHSLSDSSGSAGRDQTPAPRRRTALPKREAPAWYHGAWRGNASPAWSEYPASWAFAGNAFGAETAGVGDPLSGGGIQGAAAGEGALVAAAIATQSPWAYGYWGYANPFFTSTSPAWGEYDYSRPLAAAQTPPPVIVAETAEPPIGSQAPSMVVLDQAHDAFKRGDYAAALKLTDRDLMRQPGDPVLHQFRALAEFALGNYRQAAAGIYSVLADGPGWDWTTLANLYANANDYTRQLRALETHSRAHPDAADARFLLAYHYLVQGFDGAAEEEFREVGRLQPNNVVAIQLYRAMTNPSEVAPGDAAPAGRPGKGANGDTARPAKPIAVEAIVGHWTATSPDGVKYSLELNQDKKFAWSFGRADSAMTTLRGDYSISGRLLILYGSDSKNLACAMTLEPKNQLRLRLAEQSPNDPGLLFSH